MTAKIKQPDVMRPDLFAHEIRLPAKDDLAPVRGPLRIGKVLLVIEHEMDRATGRAHREDLPGLSWLPSHQQQLLSVRRPVGGKYFKVSAA